MATTTTRARATTRARLLVSAAVVAATILVLCRCTPTDPSRSAETEFKSFLSEFEARMIPLSRDVALANFEASISGQEEDYARAAELELAEKKLLSDPQDWVQLRQWREVGLGDPLLGRQLDILYQDFLANQLPEATLAELVSREKAIEQRFNTFRATIDGTPFSDNEVATVLRQSTDSAELERAWAASKEIGQAVSGEIIALVKLRNQAARELGFPNFQAMQLALTDQDPAELEALFDELDSLTRDQFAQAKAEIDEYLAQRLQLSVDALRPWHYQDRFFQEAPTIYPVDFDGYYSDQDLVQLTQDFYAGIGLPIADMVAASDLYEKPGKYQHAFCTDTDRAGDVRVLCSIKPNAYWMNTMLHEFGHGIYSFYNDPDLPWLLRDAAHSFTTEAVANMFGRLAASPEWLHDTVGISADERDRIKAAAVKSLRLEQLVFSRWSQVMFRFEKAMYEDPDQDLDALWWDLVETYQLLSRPAGRHNPDWAAKIHIALYPAYYHNYLMGELLASQLYHHIATEVLQVEDIYGQSLVGQEAVGLYLKERVFEPGRSLPWNDMIAAATGSKLTARYYAQQFINQ